MSGRLLEVPERSVVLLVGAAGAGKSTFAGRHFPAEAVISSDAVREAILGDGADQTANDRVFAAVHQALDTRLAAGRLVVIDATNLTAAGRRAIRERAARFDAPVVVIVLAPPAEVVHRQNARRPGRRVPDGVVSRHLAALESLLRRGLLQAEGYAEVVILRDPGQIDRFEVGLPTGVHGPRPGQPMP